MGFLANIFGSKSQSYGSAGAALLLKLTSTLNLSDWKDGLPNYTPEEVEAIDKNIDQFQYLAEKQLGGEAKFHPDAVPEIQRKLAGDALYELGRDYLFLDIGDDGIPMNWKPCASSLLKSWVSTRNPLSMIALGDLLAKVGRKSEAKETYQVILLFRDYVKSRPDEFDETFAIKVVNEARQSLRDLS